MRDWPRIQTAFTLACGSIVVGATFLMIFAVAAGRHPSVWCGTCAAEMNTAEIAVLSFTSHPFTHLDVALGEGLALTWCLRSRASAGLIASLAMGPPLLHELGVTCLDATNLMRNAGVTFGEALTEGLIQVDWLSLPPAMLTGAAMASWGVGARRRADDEACDDPLRLTAREGLAFARLLATALVSLGVVVLLLFPSSAPSPGGQFGPRAVEMSRADAPGVIVVGALLLGLTLLPSVRRWGAD